MRRLPVLLALAAGCAGIESDIERAEFKEFFKNFVEGKDRGVGRYAHMIDSSVIKVPGGRYQYVAPAHLSNFYVSFAVRGLGGTKLENSDYLAVAADRLLFVLVSDPTAALRSTACEQLGRILLTLAPGPPPAGDNDSDVAINQIADDLRKLAAEVREGKRVPVSQVVERMQALSAERPNGLLSACQAVRVLNASPVFGAVSGPVRETAEELGPPIIRDSILVALRDVAVGLRDVDPDDSPLVRECATVVLTRMASPIAREGAIARLSGSIDPLEPDSDVRCALLDYLATVGGPGAFEACVERLDDIDVGVRFRAQTSLQRLTGARAEPTPDAWRAYAAATPLLAKAPG